MLYPDYEIPQDEVCRRYAACGYCKVCRPRHVDYNVQHSSLTWEDTIRVMGILALINIMMIAVCHIAITYSEGLPGYLILLLKIYQVHTIYVFLITPMVFYYISIFMYEIACYMLSGVYLHVYRFVCDDKRGFECMNGYLYDYAFVFVSSVASLLLFGLLCYRVVMPAISYIEKIIDRNPCLICVLASMGAALWFFIIYAILYL